MARAVPHLRSLQASATILALALAAGCGGAPVETETAAAIIVPEPPPVPRRAPETLLPPSAPAVFRIGLVALRQSPHFAAVHEWLASVADDESAGALLDLADRTDEVWGALVLDSEGELVPILVARGTYTADDERRIAESADDPAATPSLRSGFTIHHRDDEAFARIGDHTIVIGERASVEGALDLQERGDGAGPSDPVVAAGMERVGFRQAGAALAMRASEQVFSELELPPMLYSSLESMAAGVSVDDALRATVVVRASSSLVAVTIATLGRSQLAEARGQPEIELLGLAPLLNGITIGSEGPEAFARIEVGGADLASLVRSLAAMFEGTASASTAP